MDPKRQMSSQTVTNHLTLSTSTSQTFPQPTEADPMRWSAKPVGLNFKSIIFVYDRMQLVRPLVLSSPTGLPIPRKTIGHNHWLNSVGSSHFGSISSTLSSPASSTTPLSSAGSSSSSKGSMGNPQNPYQVCSAVVRVFHERGFPQWGYPKNSSQIID